MSLETDVQGLTDATTDLLVAVNVSKATLDGKVDDAGDFATASLNSANASAASAATATTQATAAGTARTGAETARDAAVVAQNNAVAVVTGGTATLTPSATKIPLSDAQGKIAKGWLTNTDLVEQTDIGTGPNEIPLNQFLGELAYLDTQNIPRLGINVANANTANVTNLMQVTEISNAVPSLNLDFAKVKQLDPRITFTRASTGTYYDGKTVAKAEENLLTFSQDFDNAVWTKFATTVTANGVIAPDGTLTADKLVEAVGNSQHALLRTETVSSAPVTYSVYVKAVERSWITLYIGAANTSAYFDVANGVVGTVQSSVTASITNVGNGWYRCSITAASAGSGSLTRGIYIADSDGNNTYTGNGTSGVFVWGAQLEQRSAATAYTPTTTQPITNYIPVLMTAVAGVPRFEHDPITGESLGLEIEEQRTNLLLNSASFGAWTANSNTSPVSVDNVGVSPAGTTTAWWIPAGATSFNQANYTIPANTATYAWSVYVKALDPTATVTFSTNGINGVNLTSPTFTFSSLTFTGAANGTVTAVGNGWYRLTQTFTNNGTSTLFVMRVDSGANTNAKVLFWGAQLEAGAFPTSYIPTTTAQVTRAADSAVMTGANFSSWYRQAEGTVFIENNYNFGSAANSGSRIALQLDNGSSNDRFVLSNGGQANSLVAQVGSVLQAYYDGAPHTANFVKTAFGYATNNMAVSNSGSIPATDTSCLVPIVNTMRIGMFSNGALQLNGTIKKITYYPQRLSNAELVEMTA